MECADENKSSSSSSPVEKLGGSLDTTNRESHDKTKEETSDIWEGECISDTALFNELELVKLRELL